MTPAAIAGSEAARLNTRQGKQVQQLVVGPCARLIVSVPLVGLHLTEGGKHLYTVAYPP